MTERMPLAAARRSFGRPRHRLVAAALLGVVLLLVGCGSGSDRPAGEAKAGETTGFPVTIAQKEGEVTIGERPERVVALDYPSADTAIALGVVPVGMAEVTYVDGGVMTWTKAALGDHKPQIFNVDDGFPFETIARLDPDVILATNAYPYIADHWDELNAIAPVVGHVEAPFIDPWQQGVSQVGKALGRSAEARQLISDVESSIAGPRTAHPEFAGKTVSFFNYRGSTDGLYVISSAEDFSVKFLTQLGFRGVTDTVAKMAAGPSERRVLVSPERFADLEADLVMGTSSLGPEQLDELARHPTFSTLPAIARGAYLPFHVGQSTAMVQPSPLSLPFALKELVPRMAQTLAGP
ncbi:MAG TPA: ABC transporter substrate-binding protein [Acidimicrobiales bacterium]|nr:ABC transporter substrate-binding protein [Acidimicrobiales bacterium]